MALEPEKAAALEPLSSSRLWAEQLAIGLGILIVLLVYMAFYQPKLLSDGGRVLTTNNLAAYGWDAAIGVILQLVIHELGTLIAARVLRLPLHFRLFPFGANAMAVLQDLPRHVWTDACLGFAGPITGTLFSGVGALVYYLTDNPFFLCMACVGCFYNLFTLIPILDLEGGWIAPALAPQAWLAGLILMAWQLTHGFNLVLLCVVCFGIPRLFLLIRAKAPRLDLECTERQRWVVNVGYLVLVLALGWYGSRSFEDLRHLIPESMGD